jgi:hypothetical protein
MLFLVKCVASSLISSASLICLFKYVTVYIEPVGFIQMYAHVFFRWWLIKMVYFVSFQIVICLKIDMQLPSILYTHSPT